MAEPLKYMYSPEFFDRLCPVLKETIPWFDERRFIHRIFDKTWADLELKQRTRQIALSLHDFMPADFIEAAGKIVAISKQLRERKEKEQSYPFIFLPEYIELFGLDDFPTSMRAIEEVTRLVSAEFAIRPFLVRYPEKTLKQMKRWTKHQDAAVRRLASEGCRPRLPWAPALPTFKRDPSPILPILHSLKADPSEYVRRSVANNLNDIAKDHPEVVFKVVKKWGTKNPGTRWIIKHACRTLLKKGSEEALMLHGFDKDSNNLIGRLQLSDNVKIGDHLSFSFEFHNLEKEEEQFRIEYCIEYITSTGKISPKVFKIGEYRVSPGVPLRVSRKQSFKDFTTRKHYKGKHRLSILVNGIQKVVKAFVVVSR